MQASIERKGMEGTAHGYAGFCTRRATLRAVVATLCAEMLNLKEHRSDRGLPCVPGGRREPLPVETLCRFFALAWRFGLAEEPDAAKFLLERNGSAPKLPADWRLPTDRLTCGCAHCAELRKFYADPAAAVHRFAVRAELSSHLGTEMARAKVDMSGETGQQRCPCTLVCIKTRAT